MSKPSDTSVTSLRSDEGTPLLFTTNMGLEDIVVEEFRERADAHDYAVTATDDEPFGLSSYALVESRASLDELLSVARAMRSVHHVLAPLYTFSLADEDPLDALRDTMQPLDVPAMESADTFRVTTVRQGEHDFSSIDVQRVAGGVIDAKYDATVDLEDYDVDVRVDVHDDRVLVSVQHTREALSKRQARLYQPRAALKPNVAYALLRLPHLDGSPDVFLDPFCGSGTILLEAAEYWPDVRLLGNDWDDDAVAGARMNIDTAGLSDRIELHESDSWYLAETFAGIDVDLIVTNPPFGQRLGSSMDFRPFYRRLLEQTADVLRSDGYLVLLVLRQGAFNKMLRNNDAFDVRHVRVIEIGGLYPRVFVLQRT